MRKKTNKNYGQLAIFYFIFAKFGMCYPCVRPHIVLYAWSSFFALFLSYVNITKFLKFKMTAKRPFQNRLLPKVIQVIG